MRRLRLLLLVFFLVVFAVFMFSSIRDYVTSDYEAPVITSDDEAMSLSVNDSEDLLLAGMSAQDNLDGDVTNSIVVVSKSKFIAKATRNVSYAAFDKNNNVGTFVKKLVYTDYYSPRFVLTEPLRFVAGNSSYDYVRHLRATDCLDGNLSSQIKVTVGSKEISNESVSEQPVHFLVTNSAGDSSSIELVATYEDYETYSKASPALTDYIIYLKIGEKPNYRAYLDGIWTAGNTRQFSDLKFNPDEDVSIDDSKVDYRNPGVYKVTYKLTRGTPAADGGTYRTDFGTTTLYVVVEDKA